MDVQGLQFSSIWRWEINLCVFFLILIFCDSSQMTRSLLIPNLRFFFTSFIYASLMYVLTFSYLLGGMYGMPHMVDRYGLGMPMDHGAMVSSIKVSFYTSWFSLFLYLNFTSCI